MYEPPSFMAYFALLIQAYIGLNLIYFDWIWPISMQDASASRGMEERGQVMKFLSKIMNFVSKIMNFVSEIMNFVLKMMDFVLKMMNFALI